ncbi:MAG TPA: DNA polymerase III subunit alpha [Cyanobacteria bacterium UBA11372]|nr:DNA polymerase III subunit alpha [Cyanobacteria bacterium UBA11372]
MSFVGLHNHSDYSLLDGASQLPDLVDRAVELGMNAIALTDHGVMYGAIELLKVCRNKGVKPIIGNEMYIINGDIEKQERRPRYHQVVLAKNNQGYKNLVKLTTISNLKGFQGKGIFARPCINKDLLKQYREGLIVTSACLGGEVPQAILQNKLDAARKVAQWYKEVFGDDYYLEIQDHGLPEERVVNVEIARIARELNIKIVATNDSHFVSCNDVEAHDALLCIQTNQLVIEDKRLRYTGTEYLKSAEEMRKLFRDHLEDDVIEEAIANTVEVAEKVNRYDIMGEPRLPDYPVPSGHTADTYVEEKAWEGLLERLRCKSRAEVDPVYKERLEYELKMLQQMGFSTYFLVVWDYIKFARDNNIPVGPGRGSAAGSLVAYALRITNIDPVHHGLLFERFLNPERKSMPDIDTDFCIEKRDQVIEYVTKKYGEDRVAQIITFNRMTSKAVLKDVARTLGVSYADSDRMAKLIPVSRGKPAKLKEMISEQSPEPKFKQAYENETVTIHNDRKEPIGEIPVRRWVDMAMRIEGTNKTYGVHAAGIVISSSPLDEIVPLQKNNDGAVITQYFMEDVESMGLLKMDFLGLKNLTIIEKAIDLIKKNKDEIINPDDITAEERYGQKILAKGNEKKLPKQVKKTFEIIEKGDLEGIFQIESSGMRDIVQRLKPSNIEDLSSILALYRPGPLDAGLIPQFIDRKHGREPIQYDNSKLEPILEETYGILVYQEQIMKVAQDLAGYSLGQADILRRCLSGSTQVIDVATGRLVSLSEIAAKPEYWLGRKVFSLNCKTQKITEQPIAEIHPNGMRCVWEITTKTKRKIKATADHLFYTVLGWKTLQSFKVSDRIAIAKTLPIRNTSDISDAQIKLAAYLIGDGHLSTVHPSCSYFCNSDPELIADFESEIFWDEIVSIEYIGEEEVFDLTIPENHNFIANDFIAHNCMGKKKAEEMQKQREMFIDGSAKNGIKRSLAEKLFEQMVKFAEYCFNKSHSTAYAYVTYQTAFLKANYSTEYMAALLTANSGDREKVKKYIDGCQKLNIKVEPPDINRSDVDFTPQGNTILFGLSAIQNVGENAIASILKARNQGGAFKSLADLCDRIDLRTLNRRVLEALIKCGAFDSIEKNRNQLIHDLDLVITWAHDRAKDKAVGQGNLFDLLGGFTTSSDSNQGYDSAPKHSPVPDFPSREKLQMEKELLGFYVSEHPLKSASKVAQMMDINNYISISQLEGQNNNAKVSAIAMVTGVKNVMTKKREAMAILQIEDISGQAEAVVFPKTYEVIHSYLNNDARLILSGKVEKQEERTQLIVYDAFPVENVQMVMVKLPPQEVNPNELNSLRSILQEHRNKAEKAKVPVVAIVSDRNRRELLRLDPKDWVQDAQAVVNALKNAGFDADTKRLVGA